MKLTMHLQRDKYFKRSHKTSHYPEPIPSTINKIWKRDGGICIYCGQPASVLDHVIRFEDNSPTTSSNLVCCCYRCNSFRGKHPDDLDTLTRAIFWLSSHDEDIKWMDDFYSK